MTCGNAKNEPKHYHLTPSLIYVKICDLVYGLTKKGRDFVDEVTFYNFDFMRATNPYSEEKFHIAIPYIQEKG